mmetsp:Transcript_15613/g.48869  ORF Transcript_15613/g.48869 Transcript_15613/m.48869 type:complete len:217 (+) Transcript_15613:638-1288(+)
MSAVRHIVDLPPMFGPVSRRMDAPPSKDRLFGTYARDSATSGCRPSTIVRTGASVDDTSSARVSGCPVASGAADRSASESNASNVAVPATASCHRSISPSKYGSRRTNALSKALARRATASSTASASDTTSDTLYCVSFLFDRVFVHDGGAQKLGGAVTTARFPGRKARAAQPVSRRSAARWALAAARAVSTASFAASTTASCPGVGVNSPFLMAE